MKLLLLIIFLFSQSLTFGAGSSSSVDANAEYLKAEKLVKTYKFEKAIKALNNLLNETPDGYTKSDIYNYLGYASRKQRAPNFEKAEEYYLKALKVRQLISDDFKNAFEKCDVILTPTTPNVAFPIGEKQKDPIEMYLNDVLTVPASLAGLPAISVTAGKNSNNLPIGMQVIGRPFDEISILAAGKLIEDCRDY